MSAVAWFEIPASDIDRARRFYEAIFAFAMKPLDLGDLQMALFPTGGGALCQHRAFYKPSADAGPLVYLAAGPDLAVVLGRVEKAGGKVVVPKRQISPEYGYMAVFVDSEGNRVALHSMG
jgi:predicted enzyme related to lactoylglutathione lyase